MNTSATLYSKLPSIEAQVQEAAHAQRSKLIAEMFPNANVERFDQVYRQAIKPIIYSYMVDNLEGYLDFYQPSENLLRKLFLRLNLEVTKQFLEGLYSLRSAMSLPDQIGFLAEGEFSEQLQRVLELYEDARINWKDAAKQWATNLTNEDLDIWSMALNGQSPSAIKVSLKLSGSIEQITGRIIRLQREFLLALIRALPQYAEK